jgi:tetratricopeptide (TPR) repeat protein
MALVSAIARSGLRHRLIVTCRYDFNLSDVALNARLFRVPLFSLRGVDLKKKCDRLAGFQLPMLSREDAEPLVALQKQAIAVADGNPRLLEWLAAILPNDLLTEAQKQEVLDRMNAKQIEFREHILAETLLGQQSPDLREMLKLGLVFDLPVPELVFAKVCEGVENLKVHQDRAKAIGLLEVNDDLYRVPKILVELLSPEFTQEIYATAARELYRVWYQESESPTEEQRLEIHRLALLGDEKETAVTINQSLAFNWISKSRYREVVNICKSTLSFVENYSTLHNLAIAEDNLGIMEYCIQHYQRALELCPEEVEEKATILHNLAIVKTKQGQVEEALELYKQAKEIYEQTGNIEYKAATLHCMAIIYAQQGQVDQAIDLYQQSLEIKERIGDVKGKAATLHQMAGIYAQQGQVDQAIALYQQSLEIQERIGNLQGKAATLHQMAVIYAQQGQVDQAINLYQQSIDIEESIGNVQGKAVTLHDMASIYAQQGQVDQAIALYQQSLEITDRIGDVNTRAATLHQMAGIYAQQGQVDQAIALFTQSMEIEERIGNVHGKAMTLWWLGHLAKQQGDFQTAISYLQESLTILQHLKSPDAATVQSLLEEVRAMAG